MNLLSKKLFGVAVAFLALYALAWAANNIRINGAGGAVYNIATNESGGVHTIVTADPLTVAAIQAGTITAGSAGSPPGGTNVLTVQGPTTGGTAVPFSLSAPLPIGATAVQATASFTSGTTTATMAAVGGKINYICGYSARGNATAASNITNALTGLATSPVNSPMWVAPLASGIGIDEQVFVPCQPASAVNTAIAVAMPALGSGGFGGVKIWGYVQ